MCQLKQQVNAAIKKHRLHGYIGQIVDVKTLVTIQQQQKKLNITDNN